MARIRSIKPEFWSDDTVTECSLSARLLFIGMWNFADDAGNLDRSHKQIKTRVFPIDNVNCEPLILELLAHELLIEYSVNGQKYLHIPGFAKHQLINRPSKPVVPGYIGTHGALTEGSVSKSKADVSTHDGGEGKGSEGRGREGNGGEGKGRARETATESSSPKAEDQDCDSQNSLPEDPPSRRGALAERRNGNFETILEDASKLLTAGVYKAHDYAGLAQALHVSKLQAEIAVRQLRDRGRLPAGVAA